MFSEVCVSQSVHKGGGGGVCGVTSWLVPCSFLGGVCSQEGRWEFASGWGLGTHPTGIISRYITRIIS